MTSYRSATAARSSNRIVRATTVERERCAASIKARPNGGTMLRPWRIRNRLLIAFAFLFSGLMAMAGEAFAASEGCKRIVADLNGKDIGYATNTYPKTDFAATDQLHIELIRNPTYVYYGSFYAISQTGNEYLSVENRAGAVTGNESASISGRELVEGGLYVETVNHSTTMSPWQVEVVCVTRSNPSDVFLSDLALSSGTLEPAFDTGNPSYTATVAHGISSLTVTASAGGTATIKINGATVAPGAPTAVPLEIGSNTVNITVTTEDRTTRRNYRVVVTRAPPPTIMSVAPYIGSTAGGQSVTITGTNFIGVSAVAFGGVPATTFTVDSATRITAIVPARTAGPAEVTVTTVGNSSVTRANGFTYVAAPVVTAVKPLNTPARTYAIGATLLFDVEFDQHIASNGGRT